MSDVITVLLALVLVGSLMAWQIILPVIGMLWLFGGLS